MLHIRHYLTRATSRALAATLALGAITLAAPLGAQRPVGVDVWFEGGNDFERGAVVPVHFSADPGASVALVRVDGDGRFSILWPPTPAERGTWRGSTAGSASGTEVPFRTDAADGVGYVFAIASRTPFDFRLYRTASGHWNVGSLADRVGADPFELVDRFARNITGPRGDFSIAYAPYQTGSGDYHVRSGYAAGAVHPPDDAYGYGGYAYDAYSGYDVGYGYGYDALWLGSPFFRRYRDFRYPAYPYSNDPRSRYQRHCPDGTLAPYTVPCPPAFNGNGMNRGPGRGRDGGVIRGIPGASDGGLRLEERRRRWDGARDRVRTGAPAPHMRERVRDPRTMPPATPLPRHP